MKTNSGGVCCPVSTLSVPYRSGTLSQSFSTKRTRGGFGVTSTAPYVNVVQFKKKTRGVDTVHGLLIKLFVPNSTDIARRAFAITRQQFGV